MLATDLGATRFSVRAPASGLVVGSLALLLVVVLGGAAKAFVHGDVGPGLLVLGAAALCGVGIRRAAGSGRTTLTVFEHGVTLAPAWKAGTGPLGVVAWRDVREIATRAPGDDGHHRPLAAAEAAELAPRQGIALRHGNGGMMRIPGLVLAQSPAACAELLARAFAAAAQK